MIDPSRIPTLPRELPPAANRTRTFRLGESLALPRFAGWALLILLIARSSIAAEPVFLGYYFDGASADAPLESLTYERFTHICHAFLLGNGDGAVIRGGEIPSKELTRRAHQKNVKVILSLGGWGSDGYFAAMSEKPGAVARHIREVVEIVEEYDYDGIDLDWEYPDTEKEVQGFREMANGFRKALDTLGEKTQKKYEMSMAVTASDYSGKWLPDDVLLNVLDFINVMSYDFSGPWSDFAAHNAPLYPSTKDPNGAGKCVQAGMAYWSETRKIPKERLVVGLPLYGHGFEQAEPYQPVEKKGRGPFSDKTYKEITELMAQGWRSEWDEEIAAPFLYAPDQSVFIGYDDARSIATKTNWAKQNEFRGIFFWAISQDHLGNGKFPLQKAAAEAGREYGAWRSGINIDGLCRAFHGNFLDTDFYPSGNAGE